MCFGHSSLLGAGRDVTGVPEMEQARVLGRLYYTILKVRTVIGEGLGRCRENKTFSRSHQGPFTHGARQRNTSMTGMLVDRVRDGEELPSTGMCLTLRRGASHSNTRVQDSKRATYRGAWL